MCLCIPASNRDLRYAVLRRKPRVEQLEQRVRTGTGPGAAERDRRQIHLPLEVERRVVHEHLVADAGSALAQKLEVGLVVLRDVLVPNSGLGAAWTERESGFLR